MTLSFLGFIRDDQRYPRHQRSINPYIDLKSALNSNAATAAGMPEQSRTLSLNAKQSS
jgi:hypothetical protein